MKTNIISNGIRLLSLFVVSLMAAACSEELNIAPLDHDTPEITGFMPKTGMIGTVVKIEGAHLQEVSSIKIGGAEADVTRVNPSLVLATITKDNLTGNIEVTNPYGTTVYEDEEFRVEYLRPSVTGIETICNGQPGVEDGGNMPADVFSRAIIRGENLDLVNGITIFGNTIPAAEFEQQSSDMIEFIVPFFDTTDAVDINLNYNYGLEPTTLTLEKKIQLNLIWPEIKDVTTTSHIGGTVELAGTNLNVIEKVYINGTEITPTSKKDDRIVCVIPADFPVSSNAEVRIEYFSGNKNENVGNVSIVTPNTHIWKYVTLNATYQNFFSGTFGKYFTIDEFTDNAKDIHLSLSGHNGNEWVQIESLNANGVFSGTTVQKTGHIMRFRKLKESNATDKKYIDMVKSGAFITQPLSLTQALADGLSMSPAKQVIRYKFPGGKWTGTGNDDADTYNSTNDEGICDDGVNLVMIYDSTGKTVVRIALVEFIGVTRGAAFATSSMTLNYYLEKQ